MPIALAAAIGFMLGGIVAETIANALGLMVVITTLITVGTRSYVALRLRARRLSVDARAKRLDDAVARGFFAGVAISVIVLLLDARIGA